MDIPLKILSLNVRGLNNNCKRLSLFHWIEQKKIDIICLQETFCKETYCETFNSYFEGSIYHSFSDSSHSRGVCIMFNKKLEYEFVNKHVSDDGRRILINVKVNNELYTIVNLYAPNNVKDRIDFLKKTKAWVKKYAKDEDMLIICGDINCCMESRDRKKENGDKSNVQLRNLVKSLRLKDAWRELNPKALAYTYKDISRIDYILLSECVNANVTTAEIVNVPNIPDHKGIIIVAGDVKDRGKGYWKLNTSILNDIDYKHTMTSIINHTVEELEDLNDPALTWDMIKIRIKESSIRYCALTHKNVKSEIKRLADNLENIETLIIAGNKNIKEEELTKAKSRLKEAYDEKALKQAKAAQVRSRAHYIEEGERSTKYFLSLEKKTQISNSINSLELEDGSIITETKSILSETTKFYKALYSSGGIQQEDVDDYLTNINISQKLSDAEQQLCEGDITEKECHEAMKGMKLGKAPGDDGIPVEFYRAFWNVIKKPLIESYIYSFHEGKLSPSQSRAILTLIFKKGNKKHLKNYRPISLTNVDYKILAFTLANRLHKVMGKLIGSQQTAYIKGRFIGNNIRTVLDTLEYTRKFNMSGLLLCLDFKKAFDSLEWPFMISVLRKFNFGDSFIKWIETLYEKPYAKVKVNGWLTEPIPQSRGIRQGCPASALLFILCTEILAIAIIDNKDIKGINIPTSHHEGSKEQKITQYADDTTVFLLDENQVLATLDTIATYSNVSGLTLNIEKTEAMWLGELKDRKEKPFGFKWPSTIRYLGIYIGYNTEETNKYNWTNKLEEFQKTLDCWRTRELTLFGKIVIVKTLGLAKINYSATMVEIPENITNRLEAMVENFIWKGRKRRIKKNILQLPVGEGGISQIDIKSHLEALKASWVPRILRNLNARWSFIPQYYLNKFGKNHAIFNFNFIDVSQFPPIKKIPLFYQEVVISFNRSKGVNKPICKTDFLNSVVWGNQNFMFNVRGKTQTSLYNRHWIDSGILKMSDIVSQDGNILSQKIKALIQNKTDYISTQSKIIDVVKQYKQLFLEDTMYRSVRSKNEVLVPYIINTKDNKEVNVLNEKSSFFYKNIRGFKTPKLNVIEKWESELQCSIIARDIFKRKIVCIKDKKLSAFCFKILHRILICGYTLHKWNKLSTSICSLCKTQHSVKHMLYDCANAQYTWSIVFKSLNLDVCWKDIVIGIGIEHYDLLITQMSYLLYKAWILEINGKKVKNFKIFLYNELHDKMLQYQILNCLEIYSDMKCILSLLL